MASRRKRGIPAEQGVVSPRNDVWGTGRNRVIATRANVGFLAGSNILYSPVLAPTIHRAPSTSCHLNV